MTPIPNSFSTPNDYIDASMEFLTSEEFKCLMFATRHLLGWQGSFKGQPKAMSLSMFEHGYAAANGAAWRTEPASLPQMKLLRDLGVKQKSGAELSKGSASQLITHTLAVKRLLRSGA